MCAPSATSPNVATLTKQLAIISEKERYSARLTEIEQTRSTLSGRTQALAHAHATNAELLTHVLGATRASLGYLRAL